MVEDYSSSLRLDNRRADPSSAVVPNATVIAAGNGVTRALPKATAAYVRPAGMASEIRAEENKPIERSD